MAYRSWKDQSGLHNAAAHGGAGATGAVGDGAAPSPLDDEGLDDLDGGDGEADAPVPVSPPGVQPSEGDYQNGSIAADATKAAIAETGDVEEEDAVQPENGKRKASPADLPQPKKVNRGTEPSEETTAYDIGINLPYTEGTIKNWSAYTTDLHPLYTLGEIRANIPVGGINQYLLRQALPVPEDWKSLPFREGWKREYHELVQEVAKYDEPSKVYSLKPAFYPITPIEDGSKDDILDGLIKRARDGKNSQGHGANHPAQHYEWLYMMTGAVCGLHVCQKAGQLKMLSVEFERKVGRKNVEPVREHFSWGQEVIPHLIKLLVTYEQVITDHVSRQDITLDFFTVTWELATFLYRAHQFTKRKPRAEKAADIMNACNDEDVSYLLWSKGVLFMKQQKEKNTHQASSAQSLLREVRGFKVMAPNVNGKSQVVYISWRHLDGTPGEVTKRGMALWREAARERQRA